LWHQWTPVYIYEYLKLLIWMISEQIGVVNKTLAGAPIGVLATPQGAGLVTRLELEKDFQPDLRLAG
jgi:hypothetical protein